jgi:Flp pilus assembly protein TadD
MNNLPMALSSQGKYEQAEKILRQTISVMGPVLHPDILISITHLVIVLRSQGKYEQAEEMLRQELSLSEMV